MCNAHFVLIKRVKSVLFAAVILLPPAYKMGIKTLIPLTTVFM